MKQPARKFLIAAFAAGFVNVGALSSQQQTASASDSETRARAIAAQFSKNKHVVKEKRGIRHEKYKNVRSEPVLRVNPESLSGDYEVDGLGSVLHLQIDRTGRVTGSGEDTIGEGISRTFTISNGKLEGGLLTGMKLFRAGRSERFEGAFINRTSYDSPTDKGFTQFGLGMIGSPVEFHGVTFEKLFYVRKAPLGTRTAARVK
jgi:hypothetical protein